MRELTDREFLNLIKQRGIEIHAKEGRLHLDAPTGAVDADLRVELTRRKQDLIAVLQSATSTLAALTPRRGDCRIPQTQAQQGMWLIDHFDPGYLAYNIPQAVAVDTSIDRNALQKAVDGMLARHETLRTSFYEEDGELFQAVSPDAEACVGFTDLSALAEDERQRALHRSVREQARSPFDLSQAPLARFHLFRLGEQRHVIFFNIHHIIADARSLVILQRELGALYQAALAEHAPTLPTLPLQFADYAVWAAGQMDGEAMRKQVLYWKAQLADAPPFLELPFSLPYPEQRTANGATARVDIAMRLRDALKKIGAEEGATLFMTLFACFAVLLYRQSGKEDFCVGSPVTHRKHLDTEPIIGLFVNMVVFRFNLQGDPSFREMLRRVRITSLEAYENSDLPFQELVRVLRPDPRPKRSPLFQIMFVIEPDEGTGPETAIPLDTDPGTARFDLTLHLREYASGIAGIFEYSTDLFTDVRIAELDRQFHNVLEMVAAQPDRPISTIQPLQRAEPASLQIAKPPDSKQPFWNAPIKKFTTRFGRKADF